jgi:hypothetical protein
MTGLTSARGDPRIEGEALPPPLEGRGDGNFASSRILEAQHAMRQLISCLLLYDWVSNYLIVAGHDDQGY